MLKAKKPELIEPSKPKFMLSGPAKSHKTRFALQWPSSYYIDAESGANKPQYTNDLAKSGGVYFGTEQGSQDFGLVLEEVRALLTEKHEWKTLVIDSISKLGNISTAKEEERLETAGKSVQWGAPKKPTVRQMRRLVGLLDQLDMNVILIAHQKDQWEGKGDDRKVVGTTYDGWDKLEYEMDLWCESKRVGDKASMLVRGSRYASFPIGNTVPMEYSVFAQMYGKDIVEKAAIPMVLATTEQTQEIGRLLSILKISEDEIDKWLSKAKAEQIGDLSKDQAAKLLDFLGKKLRGE